MLILGISESHESHACLVRDGELIAAIAEERLSRLKTDVGYPRRAIDTVLKIAGVSPEEIDVVAFAAKSDWIWLSLLKKYALWSVDDWVRECDEYWRPLLLEGKKLSMFHVFDLFKHLVPGLEDEPYYPVLEKVRNLPPEQWGKVSDAMRAEVIQRHLGISADKIHSFRHEDCHKAYGFYSSPYERTRTLLMTLESGGDDSSATSSLVEADGTITELWRSNRVNAGRAYAYTTLLLGMKPSQHEFKVMGLAPYGTEYHGRRSLEYFRKVNRVVGTEIVNDENLPDLYFTTRDALRTERFDGIAWGLQTWLEELICEWVANNCAAHDVHNVILSGGVAQNIKVGKALADMDCIDRYWAGPISGDGSLGIGAAWLASRKLAPHIPIKSLHTTYLGTEYSSAEVDAALARGNAQSKFTVVDNPSADKVAGWLDAGYVIGRYSGRMEFGQRALGNRSILADPRVFKSVERINNKIKYRDFWMPFTPSMTIEESERLIVNPKSLYSPFMMQAFDLKEEFRESIPAAQHPADKTVRPQMLRKQDNPRYYELIEAFGRRSGLSCVLNTSFNLHGEAIVETPDDALSTFERSDLDVLLFDDVAVLRTDP